MAILNNGRTGLGGGAVGGMKALIKLSTRQAKDRRQFGRAIAEFGLVREKIAQMAVDCFAMRDRSWGPRQDGRQPQVGYSYATQDEDNAWLAVTVGKGQDYHVTTGFLVRDGVWAQMASGHREVERDEHGSPLRYTIEATDLLGRTVRATGSMISRQVFNAYPSMFCWNALVDWSADGFRGFGEDQDCWHPRKWRQFVMARRAVVRCAR